MNKLTKPKVREIIDDFAKEINKSKTPAKPPKKTVINFRNELEKGEERDIFDVPIELLLYRKDNGRFRAEIESYEKEYDIMDERTKETQDIIRDILYNSDPEQNKALKYSLKHEGQREPAIITCDGFLINGNRRKMIMEKYFPNDNKFKRMKVVILPGKGYIGGPPTLKEIEEIENRYQHQSECKSEYSRFNKALSIRRKIGIGMSLIEQLKDDSVYASRNPKEFDKAVKEHYDKYLHPLDCIDRYLNYLDRPGLYNTIAEGIGDREGRWEAFFDYYNKIYKKLINKKERIKIGIRDDEIGKIEDIAFKIIRKRDFPELPKVHEIMRNLPDLLKEKRSKKELLKLVNIDHKLEKKECFDKDGKEYSERDKDKIWGKKHATEIIRSVKKAKQLYEQKKELETPLTLLDAALKKLNHQDMDPESLGINDIPEAKKFAQDIQRRANELESEFFKSEKKLKKLIQKNK